MEQFMSTIADLTAAVQGLTDVEGQILAVLTAPPAGDGQTVLSADDQAALDANVDAVNTAVANLTAALPVAPPVEPAPGDGTDQPTA
jgi:hypothetical protein